MLLCIDILNTPGVYTRGGGGGGKGGWGEVYILHKCIGNEAEEGISNPAITHLAPKNLSHAPKETTPA